jgi:hypothetical protein
MKLLRNCHGADSSCESAKKVFKQTPATLALSSRGLRAGRHEVDNLPRDVSSSYVSCMGDPWNMISNLKYSGFTPSPPILEISSDLCFSLAHCIWQSWLKRSFIMSGCSHAKGD